MVPFGKHKGTRITSAALTVRDLGWYRDTAEKAIADPEKAKWRAKEEAWRDAVVAEISRREGAIAEPDGAEPAREPGQEG